MSSRGAGQENWDERDHETDLERTDQASFKKLKRPIHANKRSKHPERMRGMHRRRKKQSNW